MAVCSLACVWATGALGEVRFLFEDAGVFAQDASALTIAEGNAPKGVLSSHLVTVRQDVLNAIVLDVNDGAEGSIGMNLAPDAVVTANLERVAITAPSNYVCVGRIQNYERSRLLLVTRDGRLSGNVSTGDREFEIRWVANGIHRIRELTGDFFMRECQTPLGAGARAVPEPKEGRVLQRHRQENAAGVLVHADTAGTVKVLVAYTSDADDAVGNITDEIALMEANSNDSFERSGVNTRFDIVHTVLVDYTESHNSASDVNRLADPNDGHMDNVHGLRDLHGADVVVLIVEDLGASAAGRAKGILDPVSLFFENEAFCVVMRDQAVNNHSFAHEIGHLMGCRHDWEADATDNSPFTYNHGYLDRAANFRTIMAYAPSDAPFLPRVAYWSNPDVSYPNSSGVPMGVAEGETHAADIRKTINNTALCVANFRTDERGRWGIADVADNGLRVGEWGRVEVSVLAPEDGDYYVRVWDDDGWTSPEWEWGTISTPFASLNLASEIDFAFSVRPEDTVEGFEFWVYKREWGIFWQIIDKVEVSLVAQEQDTTPPTVISRRQSSLRNTNIYVTFSEDMKVSTFTSGTISANGSSSGNHPCSFSFSHSSNELTINPSSDFSYGETVTVTIGTGVQDLAGNGLASPYHYSFTIQDEPGVPPTSISVNATASDTSIEPYDLITVSGTAVYNTGRGVNGTAVINTGVSSYTAPVVNGGFSRAVVGPSSPRNVTVSVSDGILTGNGSVYISVSGHDPEHGYTLDRIEICEDVDDPNDYTPINIKTSFEKDDYGFHVWINLENLYKPVKAKWVWYSPDGTHDETTYSDWTDDPQDFGYDYWSWWRLYSGWYLRNPSGGYWGDAGREGRWRCKVYVRPEGGSYEHVDTAEFVVRYDLVEHKMCKNVQPADPWNPITPTQTFMPTDAKAVTWAKFDLPSEALELKWVFYAPNGYYNEFTYTTDDPADDGYDWLEWTKTWGWIDIAGASAAYQCGDWYVDVFVKDAWGSYEKKYTDYFRIEEHTAPTVSVVALPGSPTEAQMVTLNLAASDNNHLQKITLHWIGAASGSQTWDNINEGSYSPSRSIGSFSGGQSVTYWAEAWDESGNQTESEHRSFTVGEESVSAPNRPSGPAFLMGGQSGTYETGGASTILGNPVEYQFDWGNSTQSTWGGTSRSTSWGSDGYYFAKAHARSQPNPSRESSWGNSLMVTVDSVAPTVQITTGGGSDFSTHVSEVVLEGACGDAEPASGLASVSISSGDANEGTFTTWRFTVSLAAGPNSFTVTATDNSGNVAADEITITLGPSPLVRTIANNWTESPDVSVAVTPPAGTSAYAVEELLPTGLTPQNINEGGTWDSSNRKVKWGPFFDANARTLSYHVIGADGTYTVIGIGSFDGVSEPVAGDSEVVTDAVSPVHYVWTNSPNPTVPYKTWDTAARAIQAAVNVASDGDEVHLAAGTLFENVHIEKDLAVIGAGPALTIVDGAQSGGVFTLGSNTTVRIESLTVRNGKAVDGIDDWDWEGIGTDGESGGGIASWGNLVLSNCVVHGNAAGRGGYGAPGRNGGNGGGVASLQGTLTIVDCMISNNVSGNGGNGESVSSGNGGKGGGVYCRVAEIRASSFHANTTGHGGYEAMHNGVSLGAGGDGGGIYSEESVIVLNTVFSENSTAAGVDASEWSGSRAGDGAGAYVQSGAAQFVDCVFLSNRTGYGGRGADGSGARGGSGGGLFAAPDCTLMLANSTFDSNSAGNGGPGLLNDWGPSDGGKGGDGAGLVCHQGDVERCVFLANRTGSGGSGLGAWNAVAVGGSGGNGGGAWLGRGVGIRNCLFAGNITDNGGESHGDPWEPDPERGPGGSGGSGAGLWSSGATVVNCTFHAGQLGVGGQGYPVGHNGAGGGVWANGGSVRNSILWQNTAPNLAGSAFSLVYSLVESGMGQTWFNPATCLDDNPLFAELNAGNYHLKSTAGRWDPAAGSWVTDTVTSPCIDAGDPSSAWSNEPEQNGGRVNMGAYGNTELASKSLTNPTHTIEVISAHGEATPPVGEHLYYDGTALSCYVAPQSYAVGATQYVCVAGIVTGNDFTQVSPTNVTLTLTNDATLSWQWATEYRLATTTHGSGTVTAADGWYASGAVTTLTATATEHWHFSHWSGDTNGCGIADNVITAAMIQARSITAVFEIDRHTLTMQSAHGGAHPGNGVHTFDYGTDLVCMVTNSPLYEGVLSTQYVCVGWIGTGSAPPEGGTTNVTFTLTNDTTITWQWATNYWVQFTAGPHGSVGTSNAWHRHESEAEAQAEPDRYYHFVQWTGTVASASNPVAFVVFHPHSLWAQFAENVTSQGVPEVWLAAHGLTNRSWEVEANDDHDGDGMTTWEEYIAGTCPTNAASVFALGHVLRIEGTGFEVRWYSVSNRTYAIDRATNLVAPGFSRLTNNIPATPPINLYLDALDEPGGGYFYRIRTQRPEE